ncbi:LptA/OstA family protein [Arenibaculum pallidiluteum]|uniref:LptA/OstA family protein n=1 Tax=Arenibaculum pallidiluteum TaxID=2812559 RepID=UPI001F2D394B|nr:LptA/OstA family protein [Arenibaculum pallidiluteum]
MMAPGLRLGAVLAAAALAVTLGSSAGWTPAFAQQPAARAQQQAPAAEQGPGARPAAPPPAPATAPVPGGLGGGKSLPIAVDADNAIEWHQEQKAYVARGNAVATRGDLSVAAPVLIAYYREIAQGGTEIYRLAADGGVRIKTPTQEVQGDRAVYDIDQQVAVVTGGNLKLTTPRDVVTARDSLEYWEGRQLAVARGDAVAVRERNKVQADLLVGQFAETTPGQLEMERMDAQGNVTITTPTDIARGREGTYNLRTEIATLTGNVRLTRGPNQLVGDAAEVNMRTGVSRLVTLAAGQGGTAGARVRGLFLPGQQPGQAAPAPAPNQGAPSGGASGAPR